MRRPRRCDRCGEPYNRRSLVEAWTVQNAGHRDGWRKDTERVCTRCMGAGAATRLLAVATIKVHRRKSA